MRRKLVNKNRVIYGDGDIKAIHETRLFEKLRMDGFEEFDRILQMKERLVLIR